MSSQEANGSMTQTDKDFKKVKGMTNSYCERNNQLVMKVTRVVTKKFLEVEYYPIFQGQYGMNGYEYGLKNNELFYKRKDTETSKYKPVRTIKPFPKNEHDEYARHISTTWTKPKFTVIKMSFLETCKKLLFDFMDNVVEYDMDRHNPIKAFNQYFYNYFNEEDLSEDDLSFLDEECDEDKFYDYIQRNL